MTQPVWASDLPLLLDEVYSALKAKAPTDPKVKLIDLVEWLRRMPSPSPRRVHVSDALSGRKILTPYELAGIRQIRQAMARGHSLRPFMGDRSRSVRRRDGKASRSGNDLFFADWGLLHFHLGADLANSGRRVMRSRRVLIAHLTEHDAYLLDVIPHGEGFADAWGRVELLEILHRNWPDVLGRHELKGMMAPAVDDRPSAMEYVRLREAGINVPIMVDGKAFLGPGGGLSGDGTSTYAVMLADKICDELDAGERWFREQMGEAEAKLFVRGDATMGYFVEAQDVAFVVWSARDERLNAPGLFRRLFAEGVMQVPENAIWTPKIGHLGARTAGRANQN